MINLKRLVFPILFMLTALTTAQAQLLRAEELETYAKERYGNKWVDAATNLGAQLTLDKNHGITYMQIIEAPGKTKDQLYVLLNYWFTTIFHETNCLITLSDKELGTIIAQGYIANIVQHSGGIATYNVSIKPIIKCDIKDQKVRVTYTIPFYSVTCIIDGILSAVVTDPYNPPVISEEMWAIDQCYPFARKDSHKKTSCKALIMSHAYSNVLMDKIESCIKNGMNGEEEEW